MSLSSCFSLLPRIRLLSRLACVRVLAGALVTALAAGGAQAGAICAQPEQASARLAMASFLDRELKAEPRGERVRWEAATPTWRGNEYLYPVVTPSLMHDILSVVARPELLAVEEAGDAATAKVRFFTIADLWKRKGQEQSAAGRTLTEIGESFVSVYRLRREQGCWFLVDPPKPAVAMDVLLAELQTTFDRLRGELATAPSTELRRQLQSVQRELLSLRALAVRYGRDG